ncbi:ester cyclase [Streptomyces sp. NPDC005805]|uniref:ester cyclase n=1 Tax=Streptomyces sp. NPDC005805 TaxID=3157068 RepID=UPI0033C21050
MEPEPEPIAEAVVEPFAEPEERNAAVARRFFHEIANGGNLDALGEVFAANYRRHGPDEVPETAARPGEPPAPGGARGPEAVRRELLAWRAAFDFSFELDRQVAEGEDVVLLWTWTGWHKGEFEGIPATGEQCAMTGTVLFRFHGGRIAEGWWHYDRLGLMHQLGAA